MEQHIEEKMDQAADLLSETMETLVQKTWDEWQADGMTEKQARIVTYAVLAGLADMVLPPDDPARRVAHLLSTADEDAPS